MGSQGILLPLILLYIQGSTAQITLIQTPSHISATPGQTASMSCKSSAGISSRLHWYQQKEGEPPILIIRSATNLHSGASDRFSGSGSGTDFTLTIKNIKKEDEAYYYCQQSNSWPWSFGGGTFLEVTRGEDSKPSVSIYPASKEQTSSGSASSVCFVNNFYPRDAKVTWKADNNVINDGILTSEKVKDSSDGTYSMSSTLTLTTDKYNSYNTITCEVTHKTLTSALVTSFKVSECIV